MADEILISDIVDLAGISSDIDKVLAQINKVDKAIQGVNSNKVSFGNASGLKDIKDATEKLNEATKKLTDALQSNVKVRQTTTKQQIDEIQKLEQAEQKAYEKRQAAGSKQAEDTALERERLRQRNLEVKNTAIVNAAVEGSIQQMRAELSLLTQQYDKLSAAERNSAKGNELQQKIKGQADALFKLESETGRYSRNVDNYTQATKILEQSLIEVKQKMDALSNSGQSNTEEFKKFEREEQLLNQVLEKNVGGFTSLNREIRANEQALAGMFNEGLAGTEAYKKLEVEISNAKREVGEFKEQQKLLSSQTPLISAAAVAAKGLAGAYAVGAGAAALFADGDEKVQKELAKLVAIMTVLQGLQEVHELLEKRGTIAKIAGTVATKAQVAWEKIRAITLLESAAATTALRIATIALTGGLLLFLPLLAFGAQKVSEYGKKSKEAAEDKKILNEVEEKSVENYAKEVSNLEVLKKQLRDSAIPQAERVKLAKEYNKTADEGNTIDTTQINNINLLNAAIDRQIQKIKERALAQAASNVTQDAASKLFEAENKINELSTGFIGKFNKVIKETGQGFSKLPEDFSVNVDKIDEQINTITDAFHVLSDNYSLDLHGISQSTVLEASKYLSALKEIKTANEDFNRKANLTAKLQAQPNLCPPGYHWDATSNSCVKDKTTNDNGDLEKSLKARFELFKLEKEREIKLLQETVNDKGNPFASRLNALLFETSKEEELILAQRDFDLSNQKLSENERKLIIQKAEDQILDIRKQSAQKVLALYQDNKEAQQTVLNDLKTFRQSEVDKEISDLSQVLERRLQTIQQSADYEINIELGRYETGQINKEEYEKRKLAIENKARKDSLLAEVDYYEKVIKIANLAADKEADALKKLSDLRKQINDIDVKNTEDAEAKKAEARKKAEDEEKKYLDAQNQRLQELGDAVKETVFTFLTSGIDKQKNAIQDQIDLIDKRSAKEIEAANQSALSEQDKAAKIAIINARAQAQKEQLDRRSRELDQQKAKFEKAKSIADIIENTSVAVIKTLAEFPGPHGAVLAAIIAAIGAANLAKVLATPIPRYFKGKNVDDFYEGLAWVGDGGKSEAIIRENGNVETTPATPTLTYVKKKDIILPDANMLLNMSKSSTDRVVNYTTIPTADDTRLRNDLKQVGKSIVTAIKNQPRPRKQDISQQLMKAWISSDKSFKDFF